jgi:hypothetical protein
MRSIRLAETEWARHAPQSLTNLCSSIQFFISRFTQLKKNLKTKKTAKWRFFLETIVRLYLFAYQMNLLLFDFRINYINIFILMDVPKNPIPCTF